MHWTTSLLPAFLACADGRTQEADGLLDAVLTSRRTTAAQSIWYVAAFVEGRIDEAGFRAQPCRRQVEERLLFAQGLRHLWRHEAGPAARRFQQVASLPWWKLDLALTDRKFLAWCTQVALR